MNTYLAFILLSVLALIHQSPAQQAPTAPAPAAEPTPAPQAPAWVQNFNNLPETTRKEYITKFQQAEKLFAQKRTMECLFLMPELEKLFTGNPGLYNLRGACYIEIRNVKKALENFKMAQKLDPNNSTIQFNIAEAHYVNHDYATALKEFTTLLDTYKKQQQAGDIEPLLQFKRYICARKLQNADLAKQLETLHGPMDDTPYYYCVQAVMLYLDNKKEAAQEKMLACLRIHQATNAFQAFLDAMTEAGILPSPYGQTVPNQPDKKTGLEKAPSA